MTNSSDGSAGPAILIIGGSSGMGRAAALRFAARGARLVLMARSDASLNDAADRCRAAGAPDVTVVVGDAAREEDVRKAVESTRHASGRIDVVVHTATVMAYGKVDEVPGEVFDRVVDVAVRGTANVARVVVPIMRAQRSGTIIAVNSLLGSVTVPYMGAYAAAKWGQRAILRTVQQELRDVPEVNVCIVSCGSTNTPIYDQGANYMGREGRPPWPVLSPERAARLIERLADSPRNSTSMPVGPFNPLIITGFRMLPFVYDRIVTPMFHLAAQTRRAVPPTPGNVLQPNPAGDRIFGRWSKRGS